MKGINMYKVVFTGPKEAMVHAKSRQQARSKFVELFIQENLATGLQIADHVRKDLPFIGEPAAPDKDQAPLPLE